MAQIAGVELPPELHPGVIRTDAELERVIAIAERGEQAEFELAYRALVRDIDPSLYVDDDLRGPRDGRAGSSRPDAGRS
ncbi:MAG: hypothetical protein ABI948_06160 [Thermoleophilia bacterium]